MPILEPILQPILQPITDTLDKGVGAAPAVPVNSVAPVVSGTAKVHEVLTATSGTWSNSPTSYAYQWKRDGVSIGGATLSIYVATVDDAGTDITCEVTASNAVGDGSPATSNALAISNSASATNFTSTQVTPAFGGPVNTTTTPTRCVIRASITTWFGRMRGTEAKLTVASHANTANVISVSVDGGAFATVSTSSNLATLFTGLTDAWHTIAFRAADAFGNTVYVSATGSDNILAVTGLNPAIDVPSSMVQAGKTGDFATLTLSANPANYVPENGGASFIAGLGFSGSPTKLFIACKAVWVAVSVDGAAPSYYTTSSRGGVIVTCDGASHEYFVWSGLGVSGGFTPWMFSVGGDATLSQLGTQKRLHHFGHSIVNGVGATSMAHTDMGSTAARNGYIFCNLGVAGNTIQQLKDRIDANLALLTVGASDVAVIDIGRNEGAATALDATAQTNLNYIIDACQTKGYGKILVLGGIIDVSWNPYTGGQAGSMSDLVDAQADANCIYVDRSAYKTVGAGGTIVVNAPTDTTHPLNAGYVPAMDTLNVTYLDPLI